MPRVVLATLGSYGDLNPYISIGIELSRHGAEVVIASSSVYRAAVERHGLQFAPLRPEIKEDDEIIKKVLAPWNGAEYLIRKLIMPAVEDTFEDLNYACDGADVLISHVLVYAGRVVAEYRKIPWMMALLQPMSFFSAYEMPIVPPLHVLKHLRFLGPGFSRNMIQFLFKINSSWGEPVQILRRKLGLPPGPNPLREGHYSPFGVLAMFPPAFGPKQPDWPEPTISCGFPFLDEDFSGSAMDGALLDFLERGEAPVVFTLGSTAVRIAPWLIEIAAVALREMKCRAVILAGSATAEIASRNHSTQIMFVASAPYHLLFPHSRVIVHSGGIGTTAQALRSGRPQVIIPFAFDQFDNAERVTRLGCGIELSKRQARTPQRIRNAIARAAELAATAQKLKEKFVENGSETAAKAILDLIGQFEIVRGFAGPQ
jgi:rhamnosyltransferase subunit B